MANNREWLLDDSQYARVDPVNFIGPITYKTFLEQNKVYAVMVEKNAANPAGGKYVFPILFALLKNKNRATYDKLFGMVKALMPQFTTLIINVVLISFVCFCLRFNKGGTWFPDPNRDFLVF
uniref:MULE transposase domain-containing protein n=1 Tax=Ditylenchus dipsaci TaxID=166011 RepID=A0A915DPP8_9BILA